MFNIDSFSITGYSFKLSGLNALFILGFIALLFFLRKFVSIIISKIFFKYIKKYSKDVPVEEFVVLLKKPLEFAFTLFLILISYKLFIHHFINLKIGIEAVIPFIIQILKFLILINFCLIILRVIDFFAIAIKMKYVQENEKKQEASLIPFFKELIKVVVIIIFFFTILGIVFNLNVGAIVTGLGIGGLAFALAGKETLENLLASGTIFLDKPFLIGDAIRIGDIEGNVERVGFRSTTIRTNDKSLVSVPNKKMIDEFLENLTNRSLRRAKLKLGLSYSQNANQWKEAIVKIKDLLQKNDMLDGNHQVFIDEFGEYSVVLLVLYFVKTADWAVYMTEKQDINFDILQIITDSGCKIELPTQKVIISKV